MSGLNGWRIAVTRAKAQAAVLSEALSRQGAVPIELPTIALEDPADGGAALRSALDALAAGVYSWVVFTSENTVDRVLSELKDARALQSVRLAAIGDGTATRLKEQGLEVDLVPDSYVAEALADAFPLAPPSARPRLLLPRAAVARQVLEKTLEEKGYAVEVVTAYRTVHPEADQATMDLAADLDAVTFTASSTVRGWVEMFGRNRTPPVVACIGPITAGTAREAGMEVTVEATVHSIPGLVGALEQYAVANDRPNRP